MQLNASFDVFPVPTLPLVDNKRKSQFGSRGIANEVYRVCVCVHILFNIEYSIFFSLKLNKENFVSDRCLRNESNVTEEYVRG